MPISNVLAAVAVADHPSSVAWYERLLGRPADAAPMPGLAQWELADGGGTLQVVDDAERAGGGLLTLVVSDLEDEITRLRAAGLTPARAQDASVVAKVSTISDPDGLVITLVQQS